MVAPTITRNGGEGSGSRGRVLDDQAAGPRLSDLARHPTGPSSRDHAVTMPSSFVIMTLLLP